MTIDEAIEIVVDVVANGRLSEGAIEYSFWFKVKDALDCYKRIDQFKIKDIPEEFSGDDQYCYKNGWIDCVNWAKGKGSGNTLLSSSQATGKNQKSTVSECINPRIEKRKEDGHLASEMII